MALVLWFVIKQYYVSVNVSVQFGRVTIATINYIFYDCSAVSMLSLTAPCRGCVSSPWGCNWCPIDHRCTEKEFCQHPRIIYNLNNIDGEYVGPNACPCITSIDGSALVPDGVLRELRLIGQNLQLLENHLNQEYICVMELGDGFQLPATVIKREAASDIYNITCKSKEYRYWQLTKEYVVPVYLKWNSSLRIDNEKDVHMILYKCSVENTDCSRCKAVDSKYHCVWCEQEVPSCVYSEVCITEIVEQCPGPIISEVEPLTGPVEGGISITISGSNLGQNFDDIKESVTVAEIPCTPRPQEYDISIRIVCILSGIKHERAGPVRIKIGNHDWGISDQNFTYQNPEVQAISPHRGPLVGGTSLTISGTKLLTGNVKDIRVFIGKLSCNGLLNLKLFFGDSGSSMSDKFIYHKSKFNPPMHPNVLQFQRNILKDLHFSGEGLRWKTNNISLAEKQAIADLQKNQNIVITSADKGGAMVILNWLDYDKEAIRQLSDQKYYSRMIINPTSRFQKQIEEFILWAKDEFIITEETAQQLIVHDPNPQYIYFLPKTHKSLINPPGRPIVSGRGYITEPLSLFLTQQLKPLLAFVRSRIHDTTMFLNIISDSQLEEDWLVCTLDVCSLYTNIPHKYGLEALSFWLDQASLYQPLFNSFLVELAKFVLTSNVFCYQDKCYWQVKGTAMGASFAPIYADLFIAFVEHHIIYNSHNIYLEHIDIWRRYLDDCWMVWRGDIPGLMDFISYLNNNIWGLEFTLHYDHNAITFLDVAITRLPDHTLSAAVFRKHPEYNTILHASSFHPPHVIRNIPKSQFIHIKRICSTDNAFQHHRRDLTERFRSRGYPMGHVSSASNMTNSSKRNDFLNWCREESEFEEEFDEDGDDSLDLPSQIHFPVTYAPDADNFVPSLPVEQKCYMNEIVSSVTQVLRRALRCVLEGVGTISRNAAAFVGLQRGYYTYIPWTASTQKRVREETSSEQQQFSDGKSVAYLTQIPSPLGYASPEEDTNGADSPAEKISFSDILTRMQEHFKWESTEMSDVQKHYDLIQSALFFFLFRGGRIITVEGENLDVVQKPLVSAVLNTEVPSRRRRRRQDSEIQHQPTVQPHLKAEECVINSSQLMKCWTPFVPSESSVLDLVFILDNLHVSFYNIVGSRFQYVSNPQLSRLDKDVSPYRLKSGALVVVEGKNLTDGISETEVVVEIGTEICIIKTLTDAHLICNATQLQPLPGAGALLDFVVRMGNLKFNLGKVEYVSDSQSFFPKEAQIGLGTGAAVVVCIVLIIILMYRRKSKKAMQDYKKVLVQLENLEVSVGDQCRKEFTDLMTEMMDLNSDLGGTGIPFLDYRTFTERIFFPGHKHSPLYSGMDTTEYRKSTVEQGLTHLSNLLNNKFFLTKFIHTLEAQQTFSQRDRGCVASLLTIALHDRLEYYTEIMKTLLGDLVEQYVIKNPKLMLRRTETVVEKLLTNWMSICLYSFIRETAGEPLYMLYRAIKYQVDKGPVDAVTGKAKRTLNDSRLLREDIEYRPLTLNVLMKNGGEVQLTPVRVLDTDTITQVKEKILDQIYKGVPFSQRTCVDALNLEWRSGIAGHLTLSDEDVTSVIQGKWKQLNTLQHYKVPDGATVALIPGMHSNFSQGMNQSVFSEEKNPMLDDVEEEGTRLWHLVKSTEEPELPKYRKSSLRERAKAIPEIYLTRLLSMKGTLQKFVDDVFHAILNTDQPVPVAIRYFFDFLDEMAEKHGIKDQETVHIWKTNSLLLRFWVNILKNPQFIFDVHVSDNVDAILSVIAQTFIDSCTTSEHKVGRDSPVNKLLYAREIPRYKQLVEKYYLDIRSASAASYQEMNSALTELSGKCVEVAGLNALRELYKYINKYYDQIISALEDDATAQKMQLSCRLQQIAALVENNVTDL
ncbi:plexin-B3-like [Protopterus annectens]|uniref:plexin-B3-like n=1 Tax=Protopterus annectens TaxID=7888 RepID=UPI001CF95D29|nr:plexin-B3-like [Protopterus annectens]